MNIFGIGQNTGIDQIAAIQGSRSFASETSNSGVQGDTVSISEEARVLFAAMQSSQTQSSGAPSLPIRELDMTMPESLDNWVVTDDAIANSSMTGFIPGAFFDLGLGMQLEPLGTPGAAVRMHEDGVEITEAWDTYLQAMDEFGLNGTQEYAQSEEFREFRKDNPDIMKQIDDRFEELFNEKG